MHHNFGFSCCLKDVACFKIVHVATMMLPLLSKPTNCLLTGGKQRYLAAYLNSCSFSSKSQWLLSSCYCLCALLHSCSCLRRSAVLVGIIPVAAGSHLTLVQFESDSKPSFFTPGWCPTCCRSEMLEFITE